MAHLSRPLIPYSTSTLNHARFRPDANVTMDSKKLAQLCWEYADNKKAENLVILDVRELSSVTDYFVICSGTSEPHLRAISDEITGRLRENHEVRPRAVDGTLQTAWMVLDYFDVIVHVMRTDVREKYDLEALWGDAPRVKPRKARRRTAVSAPA
jgi:ribosome-associated protein